VGDWAVAFVGASGTPILDAEGSTCCVAFIGVEVGGGTIVTADGFGFGFTLILGSILFVTPYFASVR